MRQARVLRARGGCLFLALAMVAGTAARAQTLPVASGPIVLSVSARPADAAVATQTQFDMAMLAGLPQHTFVTRTPWYPKARKFTGVRLRDLLAAVGARPGDLGAVALNDYRADIPRDDVESGDAMVAYLLDDAPMKVRDKGPLVVIYPFDSRRDLRTAVYSSRAVWQLTRLELK